MALVELARQAAEAHGLDPALVCAVVEQESNWNPLAIRYEPAFYARYVLPLEQHLSPTEGRARAISWGLMQIMGQVARERGFHDEFLSGLCDPATGLEFGCRQLAAMLKVADGNVHIALLRYNGGGNQKYPDEVMGRMAKYAS